MSGDSNQTLTEVYDSTNSPDSSGEGRRVPVRRSRWYPAVGQRSAVPDVSKIKSSIDNRNPQYKPTKRYRPTTTKTSNKVWRKKSKRGLNWIISRQVEIFQDHRYMAAIRKIRVRWEDLRVNNFISSSSHSEQTTFPGEVRWRWNTPVRRRRILQSELFRLSGKYPSRKLQ